jgi:hypothetical protein
MFKFNTDNIFTGYLKQLLHDFNLPKYRIYTKEQAEYANNYLNKKIELEQQQLLNFKNNFEKYSLEEDFIEESGRLNSDFNKLSPELNVIETVYHTKLLSYPEALNETQAIKYPLRMRYIPYIKDGKIQEYVNGT